MGGVHLIGAKSNYCISARDSYTLTLPIEKERYNNNNNEYLERLTRTGPKRLHVLYKYILSKFNAYNMNAHTHRLAHTQTRTHTDSHTHTHTHDFFFFK